MINNATHMKNSKKNIKKHMMYENSLNARMSNERISNKFQEPVKRTSGKNHEEG